MHTCRKYKTKYNSRHIQITVQQIRGCFTSNCDYNIVFFGDYLTRNFLYD